MGRCSFKREERLKQKKSIDLLFNKSNSFTIYPLSILYHWIPSNASAVHQVLFAVPRRSIKNASDRNKVKRRLREAYRIEKKALIGIPTLWIGFIYFPKKIMSYDCIYRAVKRTIEQLKKKGECLVSTH